MNRIERQDEVNNLIKMLGDNKYETGRDRMIKEKGFGETQAGKRFANQALMGFQDALDEFVFKQPPLTRSIIVKMIVIERDEDHIRYILDTMTVGRLVLKGVLNALLRPEDKRVTVTASAFNIGASIEQTIKAVMIDQDFQVQKARKMDMLRRQGKLGDEDEVLRVMEQLAVEVKLDHTPWTKRQQGAVGLALLEILYTSEAHIEVSGGDDDEETPVVSE